MHYKEVRVMGNFFFKIKNTFRENSLKITGAACAGNFLIGTGKLLIGLVSLSLFTCASALYTYGMVIAKVCALKGMQKEQEKQYAHYRLTGIILIVASAFYAIYAAGFLFRPENPKYHMYIGLAIATFTFTEIGLNIRGIVVARKKRALLYHALKMVSLASSLISLVLTQTALLSFSYENMAEYDASKANGGMGLLMGSVGTLIGVYMLVHIRRVKQNAVQTEDTCSLNE